MHDSIDPRFFEVLHRRLKYFKPTDNLDLDQSLRSLGLDSMTSINLLLDVEEAFDIAVPDEYLVEQTFANARSLWNVITLIRQNKVQA